MGSTKRYEVRNLGSNRVKYEFVEINGCGEKARKKQKGHCGCLKMAVY